MCKVISGKVDRIAIAENEIQVFIDQWTGKGIFGKSVFLTRKEAENALKEVESQGLGGKKDD